MQLVHNIRQEMIDLRTTLVNQLRGLLSERGIVIVQGIDRVRKQLPLVLEEAENGLTPLSREVLAEQYKQLKAPDQAIKDQDRRNSRLCNSNALSRRFQEVPGIGPITATIVPSDLGHGKGHASSRDYAASLGVVPWQHGNWGTRLRVR